MLLETSNNPFTHPDYIFEPKIDGHRLIYSRIDGVTRLYTRHNNDCTIQYPEIYDIAEDDIILDGEIACVNQTGAIEFESIMERFSAKKADKILSLSATLPANFIVFDILRYKKQDLQGWPLMKRKELLSRLNLGNPRISTIPYFEREGEQLFHQIQSRQLEGLVGKRKESVYVGRRSPAWKKVINWTFVDIVISGWKKDEFGWLASIEEDGNYRPVGTIEFGVPPTHKKAFYRVIQPYVIGETSKYVFVEPRLKARIKMRNWTTNGLLRSPVFVEFLTTQ